MTDPHTTTDVLENSLAYSVPPTLPADDIISLLVDAHGSRDELRRILDEHGLVDHTRDNPAALGVILNTIATARLFPRRPGRHKAMAYCALMLINRCELSEPQVAKLCGCTKSDVSRWKRGLERQWNFESAGVRRSPDARAKFARLAKQSEQQKRESRARALDQWQQTWKQL